MALIKVLLPLPFLPRTTVTVPCFTFSSIGFKICLRPALTLVNCISMFIYNGYVKEWFTRFFVFPETKSHPRTNTFLQAVSIEFPERRCGFPNTEIGMSCSIQASQKKTVHV